MAKRRRSTLVFSADEARAALGVLINEGQLAARDVWKALKRRDHLIRALRASLIALERGSGKIGNRLLGRLSTRPRAPQPPAAKRPATRRKPKLSAATRKKYQTQGRYMAALRVLSKESRAKVKAIREKSGVRAAIAEAKRMAK